MYGNTQPAMGGNYYMGMAGQKSYSTPNPSNFNYPKFKERARGRRQENLIEQKKNVDKKVEVSSNLAKELEIQIKELQKLTKEAKDMAKKKLNNNKIEIKKEQIKKNNLNLHNNIVKKSNHSNLDQVIQNLLIF